MSRDCVLALDHVHTRYGGEVVHDDVTLCVWRNEVLGLVGGSGSGKTTLLRQMIGLEHPHSGSVSLFGTRLDRVGPRRERDLRDRCGVLFQGGALFSSLTVFDNIALPLREKRLLDEPAIARLVSLKLDMVGLSWRDESRMPAELSGGMIKRVALARALALEPELLLLDEPTSGLDPMSGEGFVSLIESLRESLELTVVLISHDVDTLVDLCDRIAVLADHRIVAIGPLADVLASEHPFAHGFFHGRHAQGALRGRYRS